MLGFPQIAVTVDTPDERGTQVAQSLLIHGQVINVSEIESIATGIITANARLRTIQDPSHSYGGTQSCSVLNVEYTLEWASYWWQISAARAITAPKPC